MIKHIPITVYEEINKQEVIILATRNSFNSTVGIELEEFKWFNGVPYKVTVVNKGDK